MHSWESKELKAESSKLKAERRNMDYGLNTHEIATKMRKRRKRQVAEKT